MKICYVATVVEMPYVGGIYGGGATHTYEVAGGLVSRGHLVHLLCCRGEGQAETEEVDGIMVKRVFKHPGRVCNALRRYRTLWMFLKWPYHFLRHLNTGIAVFMFLLKNRSDVVYERCTIATGMHCLVYFLLRIPVFLEINDFHDPISNRAARSMVVPNRMAVPRKYRHKAKELSWGANTESFSPRKERDDLRSRYSLGDKKIILIVCSGVPWHGLDDVIAAAGIMSSKCRDAVFMVVGGGDHFSSYIDKVRSLGLRDKFVFTGTVEYKKVPEYMAACDITIAPYTSELRNDRKGRDMFASPIKVFEYMACGKPVIITGVANANRVIEHMRTGIVIREDEPEELAGAILGLLADESLCSELGKNARAAAEEKFSWQAHVREIEEMLSSRGEKNKKAGYPS